MDFKQLKKHARLMPEDQKAAILAQLMMAPQTDEERDDAMAACIDLCSEGVITKELLTYHAERTLDRWAELLPLVQSRQKNPAKCDWILDDTYKPLRRRGGILLDLMGYLPIELSESGLREGVSLSDPRLKMFAALSLLRNLKQVGLTDLEAIAASHEVRLMFWKQLEKIDMQSIMPPHWATPYMLAAADLSRWACSPSELNAPPEEIECMGRFPVDLDGHMEEMYLFRFREFPKPWEDGEGWFAGVAGPFRDGKSLRSPWSRFERWDSMTPTEHIRKLLGTE